MRLRGLANVILTTTFWDQVIPDVGSQREEQLKVNFWAEMIRHGCRVARFDPWSYETAWRIIDLLNVAAPRRHAKLKVQIEIVDEKKNLSKTSGFSVWGPCEVVGPHCRENEGHVDKGGDTCKEAASGVGRDTVSK